jgi:hypothetical protein
LPRFTDSDLVRKPLRSQTLPTPPAECAEANRAARTAVAQGADAALSGIVVAGSDFVRMPVVERTTYAVVIDHCRLTPSLVAATSGDLLTLENRDAYDFEPLIGPTYGAEPLRHGEKRELTLGGASVEVLQCSLGAPCGRSDLLVFAHPVHAVTNSAGEFSIDNFPAHELVRVNAWHPLFEPSETFIWIEPGQTSTVSFELTPKTRFTDNAAH